MSFFNLRATCFAPKRTYFAWETSPARSELPTTSTSMLDRHNPILQAQLFLPASTQPPSEAVHETQRWPATAGRASPHRFHASPHRSDSHTDLSALAGWLSSRGQRPSLVVSVASTTPRPGACLELSLNPSVKDSLPSGAREVQSLRTHRYVHSKQAGGGGVLAKTPFHLALRAEVKQMDLCRKCSLKCITCRSLKRRPLLGEFQKGASW